MSSAKPIRWFTFIVLVIGGGTVFKLSSLKDAFYVPMQEFMNLSNTQIGLALSVYGIVQTVGNFASIYIADRFSKKILIPFSLICVGLIGFYIASFPSFYGILIAWGLLSLFGEVVYWPVLLKAIRLLGDSTQQGRLFGFLEAGRGVVDTIVAFSALGIFVLLGSGAGGLKAAIIFYSLCVIVAGVLAYFLLEDDKINTKDEKGNEISKNKAAWQGVMKAIKTPEIWIVSLTIFTIYSIYCGLIYFVPFLKDIYGMPVALAGAYGIINQYTLKLVGGPIGGYCADKVFHSSTRYLRFALILAALAMLIFVFMPHESLNIYLGMCLTLGFAAIVFTMRATFFAPVDEIQMPREISGAAMSIACIFGYSPQLFCFALYGFIIDTYEGILGYKIVFSIMGFFALCGILVSTYLLKRIKSKQAQLA
ncbi:major facilitator superfamily transporter [Campylobacter avium LMG 24591]|uniref:Major facilitator superfamily transporter n=1 Tax=Campylobacter avium LMG 24591 TaxID=522484 RepID=A0A222MX29_9BACT|nr:MFS transporter [Campylobacter avium]ASQ30664.1 major facilitator superfamily transporter [Campylobacter avium LMG 24591]OYD79760.1 major facilitator superfamily transporter [Campylobacter avium]